MNIRSTRPLAIFAVAFLLLSAQGFTQTKYQKILVLSQVEEINYKRQMEDAMVTALRESGCQAIAAYNTISAEEARDTALLIKKAAELGVDALLSFKPMSEEQSFKNTPSVGVSVGIPIRIGFLHTFIGGTVPLAGGVKEQKSVNMLSSFYIKQTGSAIWNKYTSVKLKSDMSAVISRFAADIQKALLKEAVL